MFAHDEVQSLSMDIQTTGAGKLKLLSLTLGGITVAITGTSLCRHAIGQWIYECESSSYSKEQYFLAISCIALIITFLLVVVTIMNLPKRVRHWAIFDIGYHLLMSVLLLVGWIVFVLSVSFNNKLITIAATDEIKSHSDYKTFMVKRSFALILQLINISVYIATAFLVFKNRNNQN